MNNQQMTTLSMELSFSQAIEKVDALPDESLSEEEKIRLKGLLISIESASKKDKLDVVKPINEVLKMLIDKGMDVFIAAIPFISKTLEQL